jgi:hypothetical protein
MERTILGREVGAGRYLPGNANYTVWYPRTEGGRRSREDVMTGWHRKDQKADHVPAASEKIDARDNEPTKFSDSDVIDLRSNAL